MKGDITSEAARALRAVNSSAQKRAARQNGAKGGRPKGSADSYKRTRRSKSEIKQK